MDNRKITEGALARLENCQDPRFKEIMTSVLTHVHEIVREVEPTMAEWEQAIQFLTEVGHWCDDKRQEFILLSDTLGISMLVDSIVNRNTGGTTESTVLGPFYAQGAEELPFGANISKDANGEATLVTGRVLADDGNPIEAASLDVWHATADGFYDVQTPEAYPEGNLRGVFRTDAGGRFGFCTTKPASYPVPTDGPVGRMLLAAGRHAWRPAHIHFIVSAPGFVPVTTHLFVAGDEYLDHDAVQAVKQSLIVDFTPCKDEAEAEAFGLPTPYLKLTHEFVLAAQSD